MNANDQEKVCKSGFVIIRADDTNKPAIKCKKAEHPRSWKILRNDFKSKNQRDQYMKDLLELDDYIED
ncbi:hypothetical protein [uncultured Bacteroides sp.]|jgi:hypothetical protein|uniref:hypothetical protein n=1 Tax=uncultured Bacteroides sp. TaxID=162156 RepID=UPI00280C2932|nr:hypothetical protein [uncultured Bacteroides sp.]